MESIFNQVKHHFYAVGLLLAEILLIALGGPIIKWMVFQKDISTGLGFIASGLVKGSIALCCYIWVCFGLWLMGKVFDSETSLKQHLLRWGETLGPNLGITVIAIFVDTVYYSFWNSRLLIILISVCITIIFSWKLSNYCQYVNKVMKLESKEAIGAKLAGSIILAAFTLMAFYIEVIWM